MAHRKGCVEQECLPSPHSYSHTWLGEHLAWAGAGLPLPPHPQPASAGGLCNPRAWPGKTLPQSPGWEQEPEDAPDNAGGGHVPQPPSSPWLLPLRAPSWL